MVLLVTPRSPVGTLQQTSVICSFVSELFQSTDKTRRTSMHILAIQRENKKMAGTFQNLMCLSHLNPLSQHPKPRMLTFLTQNTVMFAYDLCKLLCKLQVIFPIPRVPNKTETFLKRLLLCTLG